MTKYNRILVVRPDRIGDVVLSIPVFDAIKAHCPEAKVTALVRAQCAPVLQGLSSVDEIISYNPEGSHVGFFGLQRLASEIQSKVFDAAVVLQSDWKVAAAIWMSGIWMRIGTLSKPYSYFFFNYGVRQRRSESFQNEADYNLDLLAPLGFTTQGGRSRFPARIQLSEKVIEQAGHWLTSHGAKLGFPLVAVHPGMGGSALNWPESHYISLIGTLLSEGKDVLLTGGDGDVALLDRVRTGVGSKGPGKLIHYNEAKVRDVAFLGGLFNHCSVVVAPSTGPLHVAAAIGIPVVSFYPPIPTQSVKRWGPYVKDQDKTKLLFPDVSCPAKYKCLGSRCSQFSCMSRLSVEQALSEVNERLKVS